MWPAIVTGCIAFITLLGFIQQRNPDFYRKIENILYWGTVLISWSSAAYIIGHNSGVKKVIETIEPTLEAEKYSGIKYDFTLVGFALVAPLLVMVLTSLIGYVANQVKEEKKI